MTSRRAFIQILPVAACVGLAGAFAAEPAKVDPADPQAAALGYTPDATKVDKAKFPKYAAGQTCSGCQLFTGQASDAYGGCALFAGRQVAGKGWCSAYTKRA